MMPGIVVMGVSGCGKSTVASLLAHSLGATYIDADSLHSCENVAKMARGEPLTDEDRWPWINAVGNALARADTVVACSALRRIYRERISRAAGRPVLYLFLRGDKATIQSRMSRRQGHYMPISLLDSQIATLEEPGPEEQAIAIDILKSPEAIVGMFEQWLREIRE